MKFLSRKTKSPITSNKGVSGQSKTTPSQKVESTQGDKSKERAGHDLASASASASYRDSSYSSRSSSDDDTYTEVETRQDTDESVYHESGKQDAKRDSAKAKPYHSEESKSRFLVPDTSSRGFAISRSRSFSTRSKSPSKRTITAARKEANSNKKLKDQKESSEAALRAKHEKACGYLRTGDFDSALKLFEEILAILLKRYGENHHRVGAALHNVGIVHLRSGNLDDAMDAMEEAVRIRKITLGEYNPKVADSLVELGIILLSQKEYEDSLEIFNEALEMREREGEGKLSAAEKKKVNLSSAKILNNIGCVYFEYGDLKDAKHTFEEALELQRSTLKSADPSSESGFLAMASTLCNLGYVNLEKQQFNDAALLLDEALGIQQTILEDDNKLVLNTLENLGYAYFKDENYDAALKAYEEILEIQKESCGEIDLKCSETRRKLVYIHFKLLQYEKALDHLLVIEEIQEEKLKPDSPRLQKTRQLIGMVNYQLLKFPSPQEAVVQTLTKNVRNPFTNRLMDFSCLGGTLDESEFDIESYEIRRPQISSKMSGHKVTFA